MKGSRWDEVLVQLTDSLKSELLCISRKEIVKFCVQNETTRKAARNFLENFKKPSQKNSALANEKKEKGNEKYYKKQYEESLLLYTESIFLANKNDECLPLSYSNRSLVLQQMGLPSESIADVDLALNTGYPKPKSEKLILRKARCLVQLGEVEKAKEVLTQALNNFEDTTVCHTFKNELKFIKNLKNKKVVNSKIGLPELSGGENKNYVSASNYLSVCYERVKGRHVVATADIKAGDVLYVEKPFAYVFFEKGCQKCLKTTLAPVPCSNCLDVSYCSEDCREEFWRSTHSFECGFADLFRSVGIAHLSLRIILNASSSLEELEKIVKNLSEPEYQNGIISYRSKSYDSVYHLVHNSEKYELLDLFQYVMTAFLLALHMKSHTNYFPKGSEDKDLEFLTSIIWLHIMQLICNGHAITKFKESDQKEVTKKEEVRCGTSIYPSASMMNHSCEPSIINSFQGKWLIVRAAKSIKKGEEVFNCYGPHARRMRRAQRQDLLSKQYFFQCDCQACQKDFDIQDVFTAFKCNSCKGPSIQKRESSETICLACGLTSEISTQVLNKQNDFYSLIREGERSESDDVTVGLKLFLKSWLLGREIFYKFHKDVGYAADEVARCLASLGDYRRCILFLKCCVRSVEERFGSFSIELAEEMKKLGDVVTCYLVDCEESEKRDWACQGLVFFQKAESILNLLFGPEFEDLKEIKMSKQMLEAIINNK